MAAKGHADYRDKEILRLVAENKQLEAKAKKAFADMDRLHAELTMVRRESNTVQINCTTYRIRLEQAESALRALSAVVTSQNNLQVDMRARRTTQDAGEIPF